jgi:hypothetical protein
MHPEIPSFMHRRLEHIQPTAKFLSLEIRYSQNSKPLKKPPITTSPIAKLS